MMNYFGLIIVVLVIVFFLLGYFNNVEKEETAKQERIDQFKSEVECKVEYLLKEGTFIRKVSNALEEQYKRDTLKKIESVKNGYIAENYRDFCPTFLIRNDEICYHNNNVPKRIISFRELGYYDLGSLKVKPEVLGLALCKYSKKWDISTFHRTLNKNKTTYSEESYFQASKKYWNPYFQAHFSSHCAKNNLKPLKKI